MDHQPLFSEPAIIQEFRCELFGGCDLYAAVSAGDVDPGYPNTNLEVELVNDILYRLDPKFWLEIGSMIGGSAIRTAASVVAKSKQTGIVCIDPFTGDTNMWAWEKGLVESGQWRFLGLDQGEPTIRQRFLANVKESGFQSLVLPVQCTSLVGVRLIRRLHQEGRISCLPSVIYLDSAHEKDETFLEIVAAWDLLPEGGVLFGDDWTWAAVRYDVEKFARSIRCEPDIRGGHWIFWK